MLNFAFLLEGEGNNLSSFITIGGIVILIVVFYFFMIRPQKKQERKDAEMRNSLQVGDEVTTIGGIIGKVVSIKEETFVLESTKDRTKIRFLKGAIRTVDVKIADVAAAAAAEADGESAKKGEKKADTKEDKKADVNDDKKSDATEEK